MDDEDVKQYRRNIRRHNICVRHGFRFHSSVLERKGPIRKCTITGKNDRCGDNRKVPDIWFPDKYTKPSINN